MAQYADACNLFGEAGVVRHKVASCMSLRRCRTRRSEIDITQLSSVIVVDDRRNVDDTVAALRPPNVNARQWSTRGQCGHCRWITSAVTGALPTPAST